MPFWKTPQANKEADVIYLSTPYTHPDPEIVDARYTAALEITARFIKAGIVFFSPIVHSHPLVPYQMPSDWAHWRNIDLAYLERCDALYVAKLPGWEKSVGVRAEILAAQNLGMPVLFFDPLVSMETACRLSQAN